MATSTGLFFVFSLFSCAHALPIKSSIGAVEEVQEGEVQCVSTSATAGVHVRSGACTNATVVASITPFTTVTVTGDEVKGCGYSWAPITVVGSGVTGWVASSFLSDCEYASSNKFGVGLVSEGNQAQWDLTKAMVGDGGWILLIFAGVDLSATGPAQSWVDAVNYVFQQGLNVVLRIGPGWGQSHFRDLADGAAQGDYTHYTHLAQAYVNVLKGIPTPASTSAYSGRQLLIQIHNEPDLCYEWFCGTAASSPIGYEEMAKEYASFFRDTADAIHAMGDDSLKVSIGALAPGGALQCGCCGASACSGDSPGITGLQYMQAMQAAVPGVFDRLDFLTSHSYPANGIGYGFNVPFDQAAPGLTYFEKELQTIGRDLPVAITETGWCTHRDGMPTCTEDQKGQWYTQAYQQVWLPDNRIIAVTPFMLQDKVWGDQDGYAFVMTDGTQLPAFTNVKGLRCSTLGGDGC
mmetsp:Transcript_28853/g.73992  ORF Transcript_28853/g.73992 Transcript_28853/m.73992 type:complete len:463 (+) Transcript_28853:96-1484(+)